jgi:hypothetical protein
MANGQKPMNLADELGDMDDKSINKLIEINDLQNSQDPEAQSKALENWAKNNKNLIVKFKNMINKLKGILGTPNKLMGEGFEEYGGLGKQLPAVQKQLGQDILGEPDPADFGGKASIYKNILEGNNRQYRKGGRIGKKYQSGGQLRPDMLRRLMTTLPLKLSKEKK